ncbi:hypothetical protein HVIM_04277 [Roseomonas mucosa]|nr:hypothetical protein HVIM_04277 [Roseomonas mucosa]
MLLAKLLRAKITVGHTEYESRSAAFAISFPTDNSFIHFNALE